LGTDPAGTLSDVKTYLQTQHQTDGTHKSTHGPHVYIDEANYANFSAAVAAAPNKTLVVGRSINLDADTTIHASTSIMPINPGVINANGFTLTINGPVVGDPKHQWLSGFAAGEVLFGFSNSTRYVFPEWFGAINGTHSGAALVPYVQIACDSLPHTTDLPYSGGRVIINPGFYLSDNIKDVVIPQYVVVVDRSRGDHEYFYYGGMDAEFGISGPKASGSSPALRINNHGLDGKRMPILLFSRGRNDSSDVALLWTVQGANDYNAFNNVPAADLVIAGGQGGSYTTGTVSVTVSSAVVTGVGTNWSNDFIGAIFTIDSQTTAAGIVKSVESTTSLTLENIWSTYNGSNASGVTYLLQGGRWYGSQTTDYRGRLVLGQNYTWLFNSGNYASGAGVVEVSPLHVGNAAGNYAENISYVLYGNRLKAGNINPDTLVKLDSGSGVAGKVGFILRASDYSGTPTKLMFLDKATNSLIIGADSGVSAYFSKWDTLGFISKRIATTIYEWGLTSLTSDTITPPLDYGSTVTVTVDSNSTVQPVSTSNVLVGQELTLILIQGSTGNKTITFDTSYKLAGSAFTLTITAGKIDVITFIATSISTWVEKSRAQNQ